MNRIERKESAPGAARLFEQEVLELGTDVPREELCGLVDQYLYYQTDDMTKAEVHAVVDVTCRAERKGAHAKEAVR